MKTLLFFSAATFVLASAVNAQTSEASVKNEITSINKQELLIKKEKKEEKKELRKLEGKEVGYQSRQAFYVDFGSISVTTWERTAHFDKAIFTKDAQEMTAYYDIDSKLVGTTSHKTFTDLPGSAQKYINKKYHGYTTADVIFFEDNELNETDMILYGDQFDDADNYFLDLKKDNNEIILRVNKDGLVSFFKQLR